MKDKQPLAPHASMRLLNLLCEDDAFRAAFAASPTGALEAYGLQAAGQAACDRPQMLATKEEFALVRSTLQAELTRTAAFVNPHYFETGACAHTLQQGGALTKAA